MTKPFAHAPAHVVWDGKAFLCRACKESYKPSLPCPAEVFIAMGKGFAAAHKPCKDRQVVTQDIVINKPILTRGEIKL